MPTEAHKPDSRDAQSDPNQSDPNQLDPNQLDERAFVARVFRHEADAVAKLGETLDGRYTKAVDLIVACADAGGTVLVSGLGKSGHIGAKISATMASVGLPSHLVHPTEAAHGDLGRFRSSDLAICLSHSGETEEVVALASILRQDSIPVIAITRGSGEGRKPSALERVATVTLPALVTDEAGDGDFMAPTSSTTATLAIGDALALAAARRRSFTQADFHRRHPGGQLGGLLRPVTDLLRFKAGDNLPMIHESMSVQDALTEAAKVVRRPGALVVINDAGLLAGIFTDSDLRRLVLRDAGELSNSIASVMTKKPRTLSALALARDAAQMFREHRADEIPVVDDSGKPVGLLDVQDLIAMRLVTDDK